MPRTAQGRLMVRGTPSPPRRCDVRHIERTLDGLLDFCGYEPALQLYKKLCHYYFPINSAVTVEYSYAYREMWDSEAKEDQP